nr:MAG TPA: hypothetical protein [Caudoviricetes sp.]
MALSFDWNVILSGVSPAQIAQFSIFSIRFPLIPILCFSWKVTPLIASAVSKNVIIS